MLSYAFSIALWLGEEVVFRLLPYVFARVRGVVVSTVIWVILHVLTGNPLTVVAAALVAPLLVLPYSLYGSIAKGFTVSSIVHMSYNIVAGVIGNLPGLYVVSVSVAVASLVFSLVTDALSREVLDEAAIVLVTASILGFVGKGAIVSSYALIAVAIFVASFITTYVVFKYTRGDNVFGDGDIVHCATGSIAVILLAYDTPLVLLAMTIGLTIGLLLALAVNVLQRRRGGDYTLVPFVTAMNTMFISVIILPLTGVI